MHIRIKDEKDVLDEVFRAEVINEIRGTENIARKNEALRRHDVYRDRIKKWILLSLEREGLKERTIEQMANRTANLSIGKKIVNKIARSYTFGVIREVGEVDLENPGKENPDQEKIDAMTREMDFNSKMKKLDQFLELFRNTAIQIIPEKDTRQTRIAGSDKFRVKAKIMAPELYDVIEDHHDHERPRCYILTDFVERDQLVVNAAISEGEDGRKNLTTVNNLFRGDGKDQVIADRVEDRGKGDHRTFVWWSDTYHFTTDSDGKIIEKLSDPSRLNPIGILPFVNFALDQDGEFWSVSGNDLADGSILVNKLLTDMYSIAFIQGWGQFVLTGKDIPKTMETGPHNAIILQQDSTEDPTPQAFFASANPNLEQWMRMVEQYVALLLSTNNLSPRSVSGKLEVNNAASGIALLIEQSESTADVKDRQRIFQDKEPEIWERIKRWQNLLFNGNLLTDDFKEIGLMDDVDVMVKFLAMKEPISEKEQLEIIEKRKSLGIDTMVDLIRRDNPELSEKEAEEKVLLIQAEKLKRASMFVNQNQPGEKEDAPAPNEEKADEETPEGPTDETKIDGS